VRNGQDAVDVDGGRQMPAGRAATTRVDSGHLCADATVEIHGLRKRVAFTERLIAQLETAVAADDAESDRRAALIGDLADRLTGAQRRLADIAALCDLADWSSGASGDPGPSSVLVEDLRRALTPPPA
jgi:uncharacterized coiled-coil protein SlyX